MKLLTSLYAVAAALAVIGTAAGQEKKAVEARKALTILLLDADTKGISAGIKRIEIPHATIATRIRLADAAANPPAAGWKPLERLLAGTEISDPKREWVLKSVRMTLPDDKVVECKLLSLQDTGKTIIKLHAAGDGRESLIDVKGLGKLTSSRIYQDKPAYSDKGDWTFYVYVAEYDEIIPTRKKP
jgi:hypothetical protein